MEWIRFWVARLKLIKMCSKSRALAFLVFLPCLANASTSQCYGTVSNGRIKDAVQLAIGGTNYSSYSSLGSAMGRTYVHSAVKSIVESAFAEVEKVLPKAVFVYGETGWQSGGRIRPHRTHQNGSSVDFFVPVKNQSGESVALPTNATSKFGYEIEFDSKGRYGEYQIDFGALAEHLYQLHVAAKARGNGIALVIFEPSYLPRLFATKRGDYLKSNLPFMRGKPWVRHDEHYHIDFSIPCKPKAG
jgi:penicillin-insensitive murein DD-endopeptidase